MDTRFVSPMVIRHRNKVTGFTGSPLLPPRSSIGVLLVLTNALCVVLGFYLIVIDWATDGVVADVSKDVANAVWAKSPLARSARDVFRAAVARPPPPEDAETRPQSEGTEMTENPLGVARRRAATLAAAAEV